MKVKTLIKYLEPYKEAEIYFCIDQIGAKYYSDCFIETDKKKVLVYPTSEELVSIKTKLIKL